jgi:hypothetical protein
MIILKYRGSAYIKGVQPELFSATDVDVNNQPIQPNPQKLPQPESSQEEWPQPLKYRGVSYLLLHH